MSPKTRFIVALACCLALAACGNDADQIELDRSAGPGNATDGIGQEAGAVTPSEMLQRMDELDYTDFDLDVDYDNRREYEAELEKRGNDAIEAEIDDTVNNVSRRGEEAFRELYPLVRKLTITQQTSKEDAIREVLETFNLPEDYRKFDLELRFKDGTNAEFIDTK